MSLTANNKNSTFHIFALFKMTLVKKKKNEENINRFGSY